MGNKTFTASYAADIMVLDGNGEFMNRMDVAQEAYYSGEFNRVIYYGNNAQLGFIHIDLYPNGWQGVRQYGQWNNQPSWVR